MYAASAAKYVGVPSDRTSTRSLSSPCALVRAHTASSSSYVSRSAIASGMSASTSLSRAQVSKWMRKRSSVASMRSSITGTGSPASAASSFMYAPE